MGRRLYSSGAVDVSAAVCKIHSVLSALFSRLSLGLPISPLYILARVQGYSLALMIASAFGTLHLIVISDRQTSGEKRMGRGRVSLRALHHIRLPSRWLAKLGCVQQEGADVLPALKGAGIDLTHVGVEETNPHAPNLPGCYGASHIGLPQGLLLF